MVTTKAESSVISTEEKSDLKKQFMERIARTGQAGIMKIGKDGTFISGIAYYDTNPASKTYLQEIRREHL